MENQLIMKILQDIMDDMGTMGAKKLMPHDAVGMSIEAKPMDEDEVKEELEEAMGKDHEDGHSEEGSPEEEAGESPEEEDEEMSSLPRWKQRMKMGK